MGGGTGQQRANAAGVQAAAHSINSVERGAVGYAPHLDRDQWNRTLESFPPNAVPALAMAAGATQHCVRNAAMANMAIAANTLAGHIARASLQAVKAADISALRGERAAIAGCEAQIETLRVMLMSQPKVLPHMHKAYSALQRAAGYLGAPAGQRQRTDTTDSPNVFGRRLAVHSKVFKEREESVSRLLCRVSKGRRTGQWT